MDKNITLEALLDCMDEHYTLCASITTRRQSRLTLSFNGRGHIKVVDTKGSWIAGTTSVDTLYEGDNLQKAIDIYNDNI